jgi:hypothetical protein
VYFTGNKGVGWLNGAYETHMEKDLSGNFGLFGCAWVACGVAMFPEEKKKLIISFLHFYYFMENNIYC